MPAQNNGLYTKNNERTRNTISFNVSDDELKIINELVKKEGITRMEMLRAAIEKYYGIKIFRDRFQQMRR